MSITRFGALCGALFAFGFGPAAHAIAANEIQVTSADIVDPEYDQSTDLFTFIDNSGNLWVASFDPATGNFVPANGQGTLIDTNAAPAKDFGNGPEWMYSQLGHQIVYTRYVPGSVHSAGSAGIAMAQQTNGVWAGAFLPVGIRTATHVPDGSQNDSDAIPRVSFNGEGGVSFFWQNSNDPSSEQPVPQSELGDGTRRWVDGTHSIIFTALVSGTTLHQVFLYDTDSSTLTQLTNDAGDKQGGFMWKAPEFNNAYVFFTMVNRTSLQVYQQETDTGGNTSWVLIDTIRMPLTLPYLYSPEPFVYNGRSYIFMQVSSTTTATPTYAANLRFPSQIAMTGIVYTHPNFRLLTTDSTPKYVRSDPEYVILDAGPSIYYNLYVPSTATTAAVSLGIWRVDAGLGPPTNGTKH